LLLDKPAGPSSHEVVDFVRWTLGGAAAGHCGTLDPAATGLLVVGVGAATRLATYLTGADKIYWARFVLGRATSTADVQGETLEEAEVRPGDTSRAAAILHTMVGLLELAPPIFSAVKTGGQRAHVLARAGQAPVLAPRTMRLDEVRDVRWDEDAGSVEAILHVNKGTFVRSIAVELGQRIGLPCHLGALRRLGSGALCLDDPRTVGPLDAAALSPRPDGKPRYRIRIRDRPSEREPQAEGLAAAMIPPWEALPFGVIQLHGPEGEAVVQRLGHGQPVPVASLGLPGTVAPGDLLGVARVEGNAPRWLFVARHDADTGLVHPERQILAPPKAS
jgi:tRNA pseudouridine55 synthase